MIQGTTPTHTFTLPIPTDLLKRLKIIYIQDDKPFLIKNLEDCTLENNKCSVKLSQEETFLVKPDSMYFIQLRVLDRDNNAVATNPICRMAYKCYDDEVLV